MSPLEWVAAICVIVCFLVFTVFGCLWLLDMRGARVQRVLDEGKSIERGLMLADSAWFSEHPPTMNLLRDLVSDMTVYEARERWRLRMKGEPCAGPTE